MNILLSKIKNNKGFILTGLGVATIAGGVFIASKSSTKAKEVVENHRKTAEEIEYCKQLLDNGYATEDEYSEQDYENDTIINNTQAVVRLTKIYSIPVIMVSVGAICLFKGTVHIIRKKRQLDDIIELVEEVIEEENINE